MAIERRNPQKNLAAREINEAGEYFEDVFGRHLLPETWRKMTAENSVWAPSIEVIEKKDEFMIKVELPGVKEEDINISIAGNILTVEGEKKTESEVEKKGFYYAETSYGDFLRSIIIPSTVDASKIEAISDMGVLEITLPKTPEVKPKKITVATKNKEAAAVKKKENTVGKK